MKHLMGKKAARQPEMHGHARFGPLFLALLFLGLLWAAREEALGRAAAEKLIRLHVLAASDSEADQARKLLVRDALLAEAAPLLEGCSSAEEAEQALGRALPELQAAAESALRAAGSAETVSLTLGRHAFTSRDYDFFSLPAGQYRALRAVIGSGDGKNWWCVVFPPLCLAASEEEEEEAFAVFSPAEKRLVTGRGRVLKFRVLEWLSNLKT